MLSTLRDTFGHSTFREGQEPVIRALLDGRSALAVFPTGGGKSICYQLPAMMLDGLTVVVSPLIALMKDQVDTLNAKGISAARLDSTLSLVEVQSVYSGLQTASLKILYVAPERFSNEAFRARLKMLKIALIAVDEAHCISEWGHNFRPDYLKLGKIFRRLKIPRILALTATATPKVSREIRKQFGIAVADHVQLSFHRPNLQLKITPCLADQRKTFLLDRLRALDGPAIVYVTRQETAEEVATFLQAEGLDSRAYHAGLPADFRAAAQNQFMSGEIRIMVATIAFGMGIDKSNIRAVFHYNLPKSLENYTQEIGRAGRDGMISVCEMLACAADLTVLENFIHADAPTDRALSNLLDRVLRQGVTFDVSPYQLSTICDIRAAVVATVMTYLEIAGILEFTGTFYSTYRVRLLASQDRILAGRNPNERKLIGKILAAGEMKRWWLYLYPASIADSLGLSREKVAATISGLHQAGDVILETWGVRNTYRILKPQSDIKTLAADMIARFQSRQEADLGRLKQVLGLSACRGCLTAYLTSHFGEKLNGPCGHCDRCQGLPAKTLKRPPWQIPSDEDLIAIRSLADENHASLATPRQLARFLCGMTSPATVRGRLTRHQAFGLLSDVPFAEVLILATAG